MRIFVAPDLAGSPDAVITGLFVSLPFPRHNRDRHLVIAETMTSAPTGCFDIGDPLNAATMSHVMNTPERNAVADALGVPRADVNGMTFQEVLVFMLDHSSGARFVQSRFLGVALTADIIGSLFAQSKPVL